jgi:hypothetical protein
LDYAGRKVEIEVPDEPENNLNKPLTFTTTGNSIISFGKSSGLGSSNYAPPEFNYSVDGGKTWQYYEYDTEIPITQT